MTSVLRHVDNNVLAPGDVDAIVDSDDAVEVESENAEADEHVDAEAIATEAIATEAPTAEATTPAVLTELQQHMLVFERQWWRHAGSKEQAIREQFNLSATRYYQMLNQLLEAPAALAFDPLVVGRLRRLRATRSRARTA